MDEITKQVADIIREETKGGYLGHWGEFGKLLGTEQQEEYLGMLASQIHSLYLPLLERARQEGAEGHFRYGFEFAQTTGIDSMKHLLCHRCQGILDGTVKGG